jgi:tRNA pseudouridine-54 N-methylase
MRQIATYLINIKKLVQEHNIESEEKNFSKLKTKGNSIKRVEMPPNPYYILSDPADKTLTFESRFESGNLLSALQVSETEYDLVL